MKKTITILEAMQDPQLFKSIFRKSLLRSDTWWSWRVFLSALFALPMDAKQLEFYQKHTGRLFAPEKQSGECYAERPAQWQDDRGSTGRSFPRVLSGLFGCAGAGRSGHVDGSQCGPPAGRGRFLVISMRCCRFRCWPRWC